MYTVCPLPISLCGNPYITMASHYISYIFFKSNHHISWMPSSQRSMWRTQKAGDGILCMMNNILMHGLVISLIGFLWTWISINLVLTYIMPDLDKPSWKQFCFVVVIIYIITSPHSPCNNNSSSRPFSFFRWDDIEFDQLIHSRMSGVRVVQHPLASKSVHDLPIVCSSNRAQAKSKNVTFHLYTWT